MIVRESVQKVIEQAAQVRIDDEAIARWSRQVDPQQFQVRPPDLYQHLPADYHALSNFILLVDALNFCFWSEDPIRIQWRNQKYERFNAMLVSLILAARQDPRWCAPEFWMEVTASELHSVLSGTGTLLMMPQRESIIRELGRVLLERFDGRFSNAVESVNHRAWPLSVLLMTSFDSFRDVAAYRGSPVFLLKRAQICAVDLSLAYQAHDHAPLGDLEELTAFADYRIPQALRHLGILNLDEDLERRIEEGRELTAGSPEEVEIRAASIESVDRMCAALQRQGRRFAPWQIDFHLWEISHDSAVSLAHHRTRTIFY